MNSMFNHSFKSHSDYKNMVDDQMMMMMTVNLSSTQYLWVSYDHSTALLPETKI